MTTLVANNDDLLIQQQAASWARLDWEGQRTQLQTTLSQQKQAKEQSVAARKHLAETTKQFKKCLKTLESENNSTSALKAVVEAMSKQSRTTIKAYQEEIDHITRRCKTSETAFQTLSQPLLELDDPAVIIQNSQAQLQAKDEQLESMNQMYQQEIAALKQQVAAAASSSSSSPSSSALNKEERQELVQLRREVAEYEVEFRSLKNQDITIRKLEAKIHELQSSTQQELQSQLEKAKEELAQTEGRRAAEALEREAAMERKVQTLELQLQAERAGREATQEHLLDADQGVEQRQAAWDAQRRILVQDAERLRESLQAATRERDELALRVGALEGNNNQDKSGSSSSTTSPPSTGASVSDLILERKAYEAEVAELSETAAVLREELRVKEKDLTEERRTYQTKIDALEREKASLNSNLTSLESQLASAPSQPLVDNMKRELRILKRLEYNADDVDMDRNPEIAGVNEDEQQDLETVLVGKLRRAESDLVTERTSRSDLVKECNALKKSLEEAERAKEEAEKLVSSLEKDLERAIATPASPDKAGRKKVEPLLTEGNESATLQSVLDPDAPAPTPPAPPASPSMTTTAAERAEDDHSVATIVMAQRDRLRARCEALEAERDSFKRELQAQVQASESLKADNTKLYEKVRYLQSYNKAPSSRGGGNRISSGDRDLDLEALEQRYEATVDPFRQFSKAERQRKMAEMSPMERTVFIVAKTFLATKEMRTALFFYVLAMHLLVFVTTYHWSHTGGCHNTVRDNEHLAHMPPVSAKEHQEIVAAAAEENVSAGGGGH